MEDSHMEEVYEQKEAEEWPVESPSAIDYDDDSALAKALAESMNEVNPPQAQQQQQPMAVPVSLGIQGHGYNQPPQVQ